MKTERLDMKVSPDLKKELVKLAAESGMNIAVYCRTILSEAVKDKVTIRISREVQSQPASTANSPPGN